MCGSHPSVFSAHTFKMPSAQLSLSMDWCSLVSQMVVASMSGSAKVFQSLAPLALSGLSTSKLKIFFFEDDPLEYLTIFDFSTVCSGTPLTTTSGVFPTTGACAATTGGVNFASLSCPAPITTTTTAAPTATPTTSTTTVTPTSAPESGSCFHNSTVITYANKDYMLNEIRAHPDCSVPHIIHTYGVIVTAKCGDSEKILKLTDGHLVYTQRGLQAAGELKVGLDTLYADLAETVKCQVVSVVKEMQQHDYFGLNCLNSQVLASGLKSSTFEKLHSIPAFWMQVMGRVFGVKRASQVGDYIVELVQKMNLI